MNNNGVISTSLFFPPDDDDLPPIHEGSARTSEFVLPRPERNVPLALDLQGPERGSLDTRSSLILHQ